MEVYKRLREQPRNFIALGILATILCFGLSTGRLQVFPSASADSTKMVSVYADGHKQVFATTDSTVGAVLTALGIKLGDGDLVVPSSNTQLPAGTFNINVYRAQPVEIVDGTQDYYTYSAYQNPRLIAQAAGLNLYPQDTVTTSIVPTSSVVQDGTVGEQVTITRAKVMYVTVDGTTREIRTQAATVGQALSGAGVSLGLKDTISVPLSSPVIPGMSVTVTRVSDVTVTLTQTLPNQVVTKINPNMLKGVTQIQTQGSNGQETATYNIHYVNGVETSRQLLQVISQTAPVNEVELVGTEVIFEGSVEYWRPLVVQAATQWGIDPNMMLRIMECESNGNAADVSSFVVDGQHPEGLFQYLPTTWEAAGGTADNIFDGATQIALTAKKMALYGTGDWACQ